MARTERLRIAMVSTPFVAVPPVRYGGTELVVSELVKGLVDRGHEVRLFATGDSEAPCEIEAHFPRAIWPPHPLVELAHASFAVRRIMSASPRFDIIHAHAASFLAFSALLRDRSLVYTLHHDRDALLSAFYRAVSFDVAFVAISESQRALHPELEPCATIHHGLDVSRYTPRAVAGGYLAFLGRFSRVKGPDVAIDIAGRLGRELRIGGRPHEEDRAFYEEVLEAKLASPHVRRLGELGHEQKVELLSGAQALLFPIGWEEPFGLVMIEAMLCGCPVVALRRGAAAEVVEHGRTGFLADDEDELARLVEEEIPRLDRREVRARAVERFSRERMSARYEDRYLRLLAGGRAAAHVPPQEAAAR